MSTPLLSPDHVCVRELVCVVKMDFHFLAISAVEKHQLSARDSSSTTVMDDSLVASMLINSMEEGLLSGPEGMCYSIQSVFL